MASQRKPKLNDSDVQLIRDAAAERVKLLREASQLTNVMLAEKFEVSEMTIFAVVHSRGRYGGES